MIVDSSALVAIVLGEPGFERLLFELEGAPWAGIGAPTAAETSVVLGHRVGFAQQWMLHRILQRFELQVVAFEARHWSEAMLAYERFGRGRHPASLNFGDCLCYATAKLAHLPLLCVGDDFAQTDLQLVGSRQSDTTIVPADG